MTTTQMKKNDTVKIITGKDKGRTGKILHVDVKHGSVTIEGLNTYKKHVKPKKQGEKGQTISVPRPLNISNVMYVCGSCGAATRVGNRFESDKKVRYCKKCNTTI